MIARRLPLLTAAGALALAACGGTSDDDTSTPATEAVADAPAPAAEPPAATGAPATAEAPAATPAPETAANPPAAVPAALDFSAPLLGGGEIEMGQFAGRPVLLWFWAPW